MGSQEVTGLPDERRGARAQPVAGPGVVGRFGEVLLWLEEGEVPSPAVVGGVIGIARSLAEGEDAGSAGERLAAVLRQEPEAVPALALVLPSGDGLHAVVHGWGRVIAEGVDLDGGWVDQPLGWAQELALGRGGGGLRLPAPGDLHDLRRGTAPGGGLAVTLGSRPARPSGATAAGATIKGVLCTQGHFNNPAAESCETCGVGMDRSTRILTDGIRPSLGSLVMDDGTVFDLDTDQVIGSDPEQAGSVADGDADPIVIDDPDGQVAPVHAEVRLVGWDVTLVPRAETFVQTPATSRWAPARLHEAVPLPPGSRIAVGPRTFDVLADAGLAG